MIRATFNAPISISRDKNASLNEMRRIPYIVFYIGGYRRCPGAIPSLVFGFQYLWRKCATSETCCVSTTRTRIQEKYSIVMGGTYISTGAINDRIKVAMSSLKWTPTLLTLIRAFINTTPYVLFIGKMEVILWIIDYEIIRQRDVMFEKNRDVFCLHYNDKILLFA